ncbi:MAG TPA: hypothetical protein PLO37_01035 [Candidatus Hydrogenedentes bacterium]|nr:hypothetical protein [Candidatus Hydrogenedentota bacterium]HPG65399.1 hypothetical protein [Candidatus Hydrogenedentota bacterium]
MVKLTGGSLMNVSLYGTRPEGSGDNWRVGTGGVGKGGTATPVTCIGVTEVANGALIDNVHACEARYDPLYVRDAKGLRVLNSTFDRAGRNGVSIVGNTEDFMFLNCRFGSLWGLYHVDIEQNGDNYVRNGLFAHCTFDSSRAGEMDTGAWGSFLCFHGDATLTSRNVAVVGCEFRDIYVRILGVFPEARFFGNTFSNTGAAFVRVKTNAVGEFRDAEIRGNTFLRHGQPNDAIVQGVAFTGNSRFVDNDPPSANAIEIAPRTDVRHGVAQH